MARRTFRELISLASIGLGALVVFSARAQEATDCFSGCNDSYQSAMSACQVRYGAAGQELQLQQCMDDAQASLGRCSDACESQNDPFPKVDAGPE